MISQKCPQCSEVIEREEKKDLKKALRAHILGKSDHEYNKDKFNEIFKQEDQEDEEENPENEETDPDKEDDEEFDLESVGSMEGTDLDSLVNEADEGEDHEPQKEESTRTGLDTAINKGWGRLLTADLDPDDEEVKNMRKNLKGLAQDVGLGENAKHYYDEHLSGDSDDPRQALLGSLVLAAMLSLSLRPDLGKKLVNKAKDSNKGGDE